MFRETKDELIFDFPIDFPEEIEEVYDISTDGKERYIFKRDSLFELVDVKKDKTVKSYYFNYDENDNLSLFGNGDLMYKIDRENNMIWAETEHSIENLSFPERDNQEDKIVYTKTIIDNSDKEIMTMQAFYPQNRIMNLKGKYNIPHIYPYHISKPDVICFGPDLSKVGSLEAYKLLETDYRYSNYSLVEAEKQKYQNDEETGGNHIEYYQKYYLGNYITSRLRALMDYKFSSKILFIKDIEFIGKNYGFNIHIPKQLIDIFNNEYDLLDYIEYEYKRIKAVKQKVLKKGVN